MPEDNTEIMEQEVTVASRMRVTCLDLCAEFDWSDWGQQSVVTTLHEVQGVSKHASRVDIMYNHILSCLWVM